MYFGHSHLPAPTHSISTPSPWPPYLPSFGFSSFLAPSSLVWVTQFLWGWHLPWNVVDLPGGISLKRTSSLSPRSHWTPTAPQRMVGVGVHPLPDTHGDVVWLAFIVAVVPAVTTAELKRASALLCPQNPVFLMLATIVSNNLSSSPAKKKPEPQEEGGVLRAFPVRALHSAVSCFLCVDQLRVRSFFWWQLQGDSEAVFLAPESL